MSLLILAIIVLIIAGLCVYLVDVVPLQHPINVIAKVAIILVAVLVICERAGFI
jgi:hypothetical protein